MAYHSGCRVALRHALAQLPPDTAHRIYEAQVLRGVQGKQQWAVWLSEKDVRCVTACCTAEARERVAQQFIDQGV